MLSLQARIERDLAAVGRDRWDSLVHPSVYLSYDWLQARSRTIKGHPRFILVSAPNGEALLAAPSYLTDASSHPGYDPGRVLAMDDLEVADVEPEPNGMRALYTLRAQLQRQAGALRPAIVVSAPGRLGGVSYAAGLVGEVKRQAVQAAVAVAERQADADSARTVCWLYFVEGADEILNEVLCGHGYARVVVDAEAYLPVAWDNFGGYLATFDSRHRIKIRHEMAALAAAGVRVDLRGPEVLGPDLAKLEIQWRRKYGRKASLEETLADYASLREHVAPALRVFVATQAGRAVGFTTFLEDRGTWYARFGGFDYSAGKLYLYFNLLFYHPLQAAIERGISCVRYSLKAYESKRSRGCSLRNVLAYVRVPHGLPLDPHLGVLDRAQRRRFAAIAATHAKAGRA